MTLPRPGATVLQNCVATLIKHGNTCRYELNVPRIVEGQHNAFTEIEFAEEFDRQMMPKSLTPVGYEGSDGK